MPAATTHVIFAEDVRKRLDAETASKITNLHMFWLGSQGPDMLFFSKASFLPGSIKSYGDMLHAEKPRELLLFLKQEAEKDPDLYSYYLGFLCHYALDSCAHPLIFALARHRHLTEGVSEGVIHVTMEADIDVWMLHQRAKDIRDYDVYKYLYVDRVCAKKLGAMFEKMFREVYGISLQAKKIASAARETSLDTWILSPGRLKYRIFYMAETLTGLGHGFTGMMLTGKTDMRILNLEHHSYPLAWDESQSIRASFPQLYGQAVTKALKLLPDPSEADFSLNFAGEKV